MTSPIAIDGAFALYVHDIANYRRDRIRAAKQLYAYRSRKLRASIRYSLTSILSRRTLSNSTTSALLAFSLFGLVTSTSA